MSKTKPIRIFWSPLSRRLYASSAYREERPGIFIVSGEKFDVTNQIAELIETHNLTFQQRREPKAEQADEGVRADGRPVDV